MVIGLSAGERDAKAGFLVEEAAVQAGGVQERAARQSYST